MHTNSYTSAKRIRCVYQNRTHTFALTEWYSWAQNVLIYFILLVVSLWFLSLFRWKFSVLLLAFVNGTNNGFVWCALYSLVFSLPHASESKHTLAQCARHTHQKIKSTTLKIISFNLGVLFACIILLMSDSCMNIDFLMNCFHSWFSLPLLSASF